MHSFPTLALDDMGHLETEVWLPARKNEAVQGETRRQSRAFYDRMHDLESRRRNMCDRALLQDSTHDLLECFGGQVGWNCGVRRGSEKGCARRILPNQADRTERLPKLQILAEIAPNPPHEVLDSRVTPRHFEPDLFSLCPIDRISMMKEIFRQFLCYGLCFAFSLPLHVKLKQLLAHRNTQQRAPGGDPDGNRTDLVAETLEHLRDERLFLEADVILRELQEPRQVLGSKSNGFAGLLSSLHDLRVSRPQVAVGVHHKFVWLWRLRKLGDRSALLWKEATARYLSESGKARTRDREIIAALAEDLDNEPVSAIDADAIEELRKGLLQDGLARSTVDRFMRTMRAVLRSCVRWQVLPAAPPVPMYNAPAAPPRWLTRRQYAQLRKELPPHLAVAADFAVYTGLRMRSQGKLTWDRIDLRARRAWIPGVQMKAGRALGIPLSRPALKALRQAKALNPEGERVFQYEGAPIDNFNTKAFRKAAARAGAAGLRWHDLRHTFAAWAVQSGVTLQELMALGGWASYASVLVYAHLAPDHLAAAAEKVGRFRAQAKTANRA
jgi:integrase